MNVFSGENPKFDHQDTLYMLPQQFFSEADWIQVAPIDDGSIRRCP